MSCQCCRFLVVMDAIVKCISGGKKGVGVEQLPSDTPSPHYAVLNTTMTPAPWCYMTLNIPISICFSLIWQKIEINCVDDSNEGCWSLNYTCMFGFIVTPQNVHNRQQEMWLWGCTPSTR